MPLNGDPTADIDDVFDRTLAEFWALADEIVALPARTPEDLAGKAKTLRLVSRGLNGEEDHHIARHVFGLVRDMVGEG